MREISIENSLLDEARGMARLNLSSELKTGKWAYVFDDFFREICGYTVGNIVLAVCETAEVIMTATKEQRVQYAYPKDAKKKAREYLKATKKVLPECPDHLIKEMEDTTGEIILQGASLAVRLMQPTLDKIFAPGSKNTQDDVNLCGKWGKEEANNYTAYFNLKPASSKMFHILMMSVYTGGAMGVIKEFNWILHQIKVSGSDRAEPFKTFFFSTGNKPGEELTEITEEMDAYEKAAKELDAFPFFENDGNQNVQFENRKERTMLTINGIKFPHTALMLKYCYNNGGRKALNYLKQNLFKKLNVTQVR